MLVAIGPGHSTETPTLVPSSSCSSASDSDSDGVFAHRVRPLVGAAAVLEAGDRGGVDDVPLLAVLQDRGNEVADAVDDPPDVHADHEFPVGSRHVDQPGAVHRHAGVVAGDVELAEVAFCLGQGIEHGLLLRHVDPHRHDALVGAGEAVRRLLDRVFLDVGHDDVGAGLGERGRDAEANAGRGAGDDGGLAGNVHEGLSKWYPTTAPPLLHGGQRIVMSLRRAGPARGRAGRPADPRPSPSYAGGECSGGQPIDLRRGAAVERRLLCCRCVGGDALERVPQLGVAAGLLVRREVALEHAAVDAERLDAVLDIRPPGRGEILGPGRHVAFMEVEADRYHAETAELAIDVRAFRQLGDVLAPAGEDFLRRWPCTGPTPSTPPTWLRMMVVPGNARARSIASGSCG